MEKFEYDLHALASKLLSSKQMVQVSVKDNIYGFIYRQSSNTVQMWRNDMIIYSCVVNGPIVTAKGIKDTLEKGIYILDYQDIKDCYHVISEPILVAKDKVYQDLKLGRFNTKS